jgi:hypothetical protein
MSNREFFRPSCYRLVHVGRRVTTPTCVECLHFFTEAGKCDYFVRNIVLELLRFGGDADGQHACS